MHVTVISPERAVFDGAADAVVAPAFDGQVGILPGHAPFMTLLGKGVLTVRVAGAAIASRSPVDSSRWWATRSASSPTRSKRRNAVYHAPVNSSLGGLSVCGS